VVCSQAECQRRRRSDYHRQKLRTDPEYRQVAAIVSESGARLIPTTFGNTLRNIGKRSSRIASGSNCVTQSAGFVGLKRTT
jgi:hypothetical protein